MSEAFPIKPVGFMFPITGPGVLASPSLKVLANTMSNKQIVRNLLTALMVSWRKHANDLGSGFRCGLLCGKLKS